MGGGGDLVLLPLDPLAMAVTFKNPRSILASVGPCPLSTQPPNNNNNHNHNHNNHKYNHHKQRQRSR